VAEAVDGLGVEGEADDLHALQVVRHPPLQRLAHRPHNVGGKVDIAGQVRGLPHIGPDGEHRLVDGEAVDRRVGGLQGRQGGPGGGRRRRLIVAPGDGGAAQHQTAAERAEADQNGGRGDERPPAHPISPRPGLWPRDAAWRR